MVVIPDLSSASPEFQRLAEAINLLKMELLPQNLEDDDFAVNHLQQSAEELSRLSTQAKAFTALSHAESMAIIVENHAINIWRTQQRVTIPLLNLMIFFPKRKNDDAIKFNREIQEVQRIQLETYVNDQIQEINNLFRKKVKDNHGIREANLYSLLIPLGLNIDVFDRPWIQEIDFLADERGEIVHKSRYSISQPVNPKDKFEQVYKILYGRDLKNRIVFKGLIDLDRELLHLCL